MFDAIVSATAEIFLDPLNFFRMYLAPSACDLIS